MSLILLDSVCTAGAALVSLEEQGQQSQQERMSLPLSGLSGWQQLCRMNVPVLPDTAGPAPARCANKLGGTEGTCGAGSQLRASPAASWGAEPGSGVAHPAGLCPLTVPHPAGLCCHCPSCQSQIRMCWTLQTVSPRSVQPWGAGTAIQLFPTPR